MKIFFSILLCVLIICGTSGCIHKEAKSEKTPDETECVWNGENSFLVSSSLWMPGTCTDKGKDYEINTVNHMEKNDTVNVEMKYPSLTGNTREFDRVNELIKSQVYCIYEDWARFVEADSKVTLELDYEVALAGKRFISIVFQGYANNTSAVHPSSIVFTMNIDLESQEQVKVCDVIKFNEAFFETVRKNFVKNLSNEQREYIESLDLKALFDRADETNSSVFVYYTYDALNVIFLIPHAIGDFAEITIINA